MQQLGLITTDNRQKIWIDDSSESPILKYKDGNKEVPITNRNTAAKLSDLEYSLRKRDWTIDKRLVVINVGDKKNLCYRISDNDLDPVADFSSEILEYRSKLLSDEEVSENFIEINHENSEETGDLINEYYRQLVKNDEVPEIIDDDVYKEGNQLNYEDELSKNNVIEIIQLSSSMYTNIVNINKNLQEATYKNIIRFGVTWTKVTNLGDIENYNKDFSISPLKMGLDGKLEKPNIIIEEDDIVIEYIDGCIRAFTKSRNIKECVISYCYLING